MTASFETIEPVAARAWPPEAVETLGGWRLHASSGFSGRSNCCWPIGAPDRPIEAAVDAAEAWYAARDLPPLFKPVDAPASEPLIQALAARGYRPRTKTLVMTGPLADGDAGPALVSDLVGEGFAGLFAAVQDDPADAAERIGTLRRIAAPRAFASVEIDGRTAAIGACAVEGGWAGIFGMRTTPDHRRQGLARAVIAALSDAAREAGARRAYLQVEADNGGAIRLYESLGFAPAYGYRYWDRRDDA
ncbi:MAG: GNAT family N-acetyltransferase [Caulobacteraceae bacterium]|nr:GNAT family N-acetyltransferase [Caulobacteraceae bacterium]